MKKIIYLILIIFAVISCTKEPIDEYTNGGVLPEVVETENTMSLEGTVWVLTEFQKSRVVDKPNDTISFLSLNTYSLNGKKLESYRYMLRQSMDLGNPFDLSLYGFTPFGDIGIWETTLMSSFIEEGEINLSIFEEPNNQNNVKIKASFIRIK